MSLDKLIKYFDESGYPVNIAVDMDNDKLARIGQQVCQDMEIDDESRSTWKLLMGKALKIAEQKHEKTDYPWENAANVKFPLIPVACISFGSHSYPEVIRNGRVVDLAVFGKDPDGQKQQRSKRVADHMNYQLLYENKDWETSQDRLCHVLPLIGHVFKKTYYDPLKKRNCSELCLPDKIIVNNKTTSLESARRITHIVQLYWNDIVERINCGLYRDIKKDLQAEDGLSDKEKSEKIASVLSTMSEDNDADPIHEILEQHRFLDLDEDGYQEPYIVLVHKHSEKVLAIYPRFELEGVELQPKAEGESEKVKRITPECYFEDFIYLPSPDGSYYGLGLGALLYPLNEAINSIINQLIDAGTLSNLQGGFVGRGLKIRGGSLKFQPGEFKPVDVGTADDIAKNFYIPPFKEPSAVLLQLLDVLISAAKELATITDITTGQQNAQNVPATTASILETSSMKIYSAAQRRMIRSLGEEFKRWYKLNRKYLDPEVYFQFNDDVQVVAQQDYEDESLDVKPVADPNIASQAQRMMRMNALMMVKDDPRVNGAEVLQRYFDELQLPAPEKLMAPPSEPPPDPKILELQLKDKQLMIESRFREKDQEIELQRLINDRIKLQIDAAKAGAQIEKLKADAITDYHYAGLDSKRVDNERTKAEAQARQADAGRRASQGNK